MFMELELYLTNEESIVEPNDVGKPMLRRWDASRSLG